jgi:hypothetical protein
MLSWLVLEVLGAFAVGCCWAAAGVAEEGLWLLLRLRALAGSETVAVTGAGPVELGLAESIAGIVTCEDDKR